HLFSKKEEINKGSGYSSISADRISIGWTSSYAILLFADYDYSFSTRDELSQMLYTDSLQQANMYAEQMAKAIADSTAMANALREANDSVVADSVREKNKNELLKEENAMLLKLANDSTPEENWTPEPEEYNSQYDYSSIDNSEHRKDSITRIKAMHQLTYLINLNYEESVQSVPNFRTINAEVSDAVYWYNYGEMMQQYYERNMLRNRNSFRYLGMGSDTASIHNMWLGSYMVSIIHFEGNIAKMEQRSYFSPSLQQTITGMYSGRVDKKMFRYVKGENLLGYVAMSVNVEKMMKFYGSVYRETITNSMAGMTMYQNYYMMMWDLLRVFVDDKTLYNLLDGKFLFAVTDLKPYTASYVTY
ncbi:MAG TPA: hypothetical protein VFJ43_17850, partial [Bacteroidia bacterium]|nr:hypothetical protein [Bacteroidia bacterium]